MHLYFVDKNLTVTKQVDRGYLMQYSDGVDMVFFAMEGANALQPENQTAHLYGQTLDTKLPLVLMMNWDSIEYNKEKYFGWSVTIPSTFTQVAGTIDLNCVITEITEGTEGVEHIISTCKLVVNESAGDSPWTDAINYAQWKELISYFLSTKQFEDYVTLATEQTITGEKTFIEKINVSDDSGVVSEYSALGIKMGDTTYQFPVKDDNTYIFATTADITSATEDAVTKSGSQTITGDKTFTGVAEIGANGALKLGRFGTSVTDLKNRDVFSHWSYMGYEQYTLGNTSVALNLTGLTARPTYATASASKYIALSDDVSSALSEAKTYADGKVSDEASARESGDASTLESAKEYTDEAIKSIDHSKYVTIDTEQTITAAKTFSAAVHLNQILNTDNERFIDYDKTNGNAFGNTNAKLSLYGYQDHPYYYASGESDYKQIALLSDIHITAEDYSI